MEPYRPSRWELIAGRRNWRGVVLHHIKQVARAVWRSAARGHKAILPVLFFGAIVVLGVHLDAREKRRLAEQSLQDLKEARAVTERALVNWVQWRDAFLGDRVAVCFHAHDFSRAPVELGDPSEGRKPLSYTITCQIGPQGQLPQNKVVCDQDLCKLSNLN